MHPEGLTIITPTGDRPLPLAILAGYIAAQDFAGPVDWIVVDDGATPSPAPAVARYHYRGPGNPDGIVGTLPANVRTALAMGPRFPRIVFMEDDDYYAPGYLSTVAAWLDAGHEIVGEGFARYYRLPTRTFRRMPNGRHASLSQTSIQGPRMLAKLADLCTTPPDSFVDLRLWADEAGYLHDDRGDRDRLHVSLKALPGRKGIGNGHNPHFHWEGTDGDDFRQLAAWCPNWGLYRDIWRAHFA